MSRELWLDPIFGVSGDMLLGALFGLGVEPDLVIAELEKLGLEGWSISATTARRCGVVANRAEVTTEDSSHARHWATIDALLATVDLPASVTAGARSTFRSLGEIEAAQHGVTIDEVHFHEVGAVDAILDITGAWLCWHILGEPTVSFGPVGLGHGTVNAAHGELPLPAPATAALLIGVPVRTMDAASETVTPTGAALLTTMASRRGSMPSGVIEVMARGAGGRDPAGYPNVVSAYLIETATAPIDGGEMDELAESKLVLATNIDDATGEQIAYTIEQLLIAGADDAWANPIIMKKGRPAVELCALSSPATAASLRTIMMRETGSLGVRQTSTTRFAAHRTTREVTVDGFTVHIKVGPYGSKPEYDDLVAVAKATGRPLREIAAEAVLSL